MTRCSATNYADIPSELRSRRRWVCYKVEPPKKSEGKPQKVPYQLDGRHASSTDPATWSSFEDVCEAVRAGRFDGISYVLCSEDGLVCVDLDHARNPETGEAADWAWEHIKRLDSYTEISPSGTGFHIFLKGSIPRALKTDTIEVYATAKIMATTGDVVFPYLTIEARDLSWLCGAYEPPKRGPRAGMGAAKHKPAVGHSESERDYRLIAWLHKMYRTEDAAVLEAKFRLRYPERYAQRLREKGMRGRVTYIRYSIDKFLQKQAEKRTNRCAR